MVQPVGGANQVQMDAIGSLIGSGDVESVMVAFGVERAQNMEALVKAKVADMRARNASIQELQQAMQTIRAAKPEKEGTSAASPEMTKALAVLEKNGISLPSGISSPEQTKVDKLEQVQGMLDKMSVSSDTKGAAITWKGGDKWYDSEWSAALDTMRSNPNIKYSGQQAGWNGKNDYLLYNGAFKDLNNSVASELSKAKAAPATLSGKKEGFDDLLTNMQSKIDELTSNDQLDMIQLQSMVGKQNNAIEMVSNLVSKFQQLKDKIVGNMR